MSVQAVYRSRSAQPHEAVLRLVRHGDQIVVPTSAGEPPALLSALSECRRQLSNVTVAQMLAGRSYDYFDPGTVDHVRHVSMFFGPASRAGGRDGWVDFIPTHFSEAPTLIERGHIAADVVFAMASPMDDEGMFAIGVSPDYTMAAIGRARAVVLEVNPNVPFSHGQCHVHVSRVSAIVESDGPLFEAAPPKVGPVQQAIGAYVAELVEDGSTLQIGYGGISDAVGAQLTAKRDLGIHTEMIGDTILRLVECGAVTNRRKNYLPGRMVATFALGSARLYRYMDRNAALEMHPADFTNDPWLASRNDNLVAINGTLQVDLLGQCGSESLGRSPYSGDGRASRFRARRGPLARRQGDPGTAVDRAGRHGFANRADAGRRHARQHEQERRRLRRDRVRRGAAARQVLPAPRAGVDRDRTPRLPGRAAQPGAEDARPGVGSAHPPVPKAGAQGDASMAAGRKKKRASRARRKSVDAVHTVKAALHVPGLSKAGSSLTLHIYARSEKIGEIELGRGSLFWRGGKRQKRKRIGWTRFAEMMDDLAYG